MNPTDNQTPQPVDELEQLIREIMQNGFEVAMGGLYDLTPEENEARQRAEYDRVTAEAKAQLNQLLIKERIDLLARIHCCDNEPENTIEPLNVCMEEHTQLKANLENQLGEKS